HVQVELLAPRLVLVEQGEEAVDRGPVPRAGRQRYEPGLARDPDHPPRRARRQLADDRLLAAASGPRVDRDAARLRELDRLRVQDLGPGLGQLLHLFVAELGQAAGIGHDARAGGVAACALALRPARP